MLVRQVTVFHEYSAEKLRDETKLLGKSKINKRALSIAETDDYGLVRLVVNDYYQTYK